MLSSHKTFQTTSSQSGMVMNQLSHLDEKGHVRKVDRRAMVPAVRKAIARGVARVRPEKAALSEWGAIPRTETQGGRRALSGRG